MSSDLSFLTPAASSRLPVDAVLQRQGLRRIPDYPFDCGDCFFDSICYVLGKRPAASPKLRIKMVDYYIWRLEEEDLQAVDWKANFLVYDNLCDLHPELRCMRDKEQCAQEYLRRMKLAACYGGLWGDSFCVYWMQELLGRPIFIWVADTGKVIDNSNKQRSCHQIVEDGIHLVFHSSWNGSSVSHYEPALVVEDIDEEEEEYESTIAGDDDLDLDTEFSNCEVDWKDEDAEEQQPLEALVEVSRRRHAEIYESERKSAQPLEEQDENQRPGTSSCSSNGTPARALKRSHECMQVPEKIDPYQAKIEAVVARVKQQRLLTKCKSSSDATALADFEVLNLLQDRAATKGITESEQKVAQYLSDRRAGEASIYKNQASQSTTGYGNRPWSLACEPLLCRLNSREHLMMANLRPSSPVEVHLIVENIENRFTEDEVNTVIERIVADVDIAEKRESVKPVEPEKQEPSELT